MTSLKTLFAAIQPDPHIAFSQARSMARKIELYGRFTKARGMARLIALSEYICECVLGRYSNAPGTAAAQKISGLQVSDVGWVMAYYSSEISRVDLIRLRDAMIGLRVPRSTRARLSRDPVRC